MSSQGVASAAAVVQVPELSQARQLGQASASQQLPSVQKPTAQSVASQDWYELACRDVLEDVAAEVAVEAASLDSEHPGLVVQGECDFLDTTYAPRESRACEGVLTEVSWGSESLTGSHLMSLEMPD